MLFDRETFKLVVERSGLTKSELGMIYQVSRQHIYALVDKARPHNQDTVRRHNIYTVALKTLIDKGVLPLAAPNTGPVRKERIENIVKKLYDLARPK